MYALGSVSQPLHLRIHPGCPPPEAFPDRANKIFHAIEEMRGGKRNETEFHRRMVGRGPRWETIEALFDAQCRRLGINAGDEDDADDEPSPFRRPSPQGDLFPEGSG